MTWLVAALGAALIPAIPLIQVSTSQLAKARSYWLLGLLTAGICYLAWTELWLALIGVAFLCRWRTHEPMPSLFQWGAIGAMWGLLLQIPAAAYDWIALGWMGVAVWQAVILSQRWWVIRKRMVGSLGSPAITGMYLALVLPLAPLWLVPAFALGFVFTSSVLALMAVAVAAVWMEPRLLTVVLGAGGLVAALWAWSPTIAGRRIGEWTLRGDTLDSVWARLYVWRIVAHDLTTEKAWLLGLGPNQTAKRLRVWASRIRVELPHEAHCEIVQMAHEYGIVGVLAAAAFVWRVAPHLTIGDPWSAAWLAGCVLTLAHWPGRHPTIGPVFLAISARVVLG